MVTHKHPGKFPVRVASAYLMIIVFAYIYIHHVVNNYGDIIEKVPKYDLLGKYKCVPDFPGCGNQYIDGWAIARVLAYVLVGIANPHSHVKTLAVAVMVQAYAYTHNSVGRHVLNPVLTMVGYSIGSMMCTGDCVLKTHIPITRSG